jgi:hypothetical protein
VVRSTLDVFDRFTSKAYVSVLTPSVGADYFFAHGQYHIRSSDPVIEPMLQSVPDPFDSYGHPHSEDQIFSILPPLSILAPSSSPGPLTATPQTVTSDVFATGTSTGWTHGNGTLYSDAVSEWADAVPSTSSSLLRSPTKPRSSSPPRHPNRPSSQLDTNTRRAESKLRSVLSVIDEAPHTKHVDNVLPPGAEDAVVDPAAKGPSGARDSGVSWTSFPFGEYPRSESQDTTPRHSIIVPPSPTADVSRADAQGRQTPESERTTFPISS